MILDSDRFIKTERPHWKDLERRLTRLDESMPGSGDPDFLLEIHNLYRRAASGLSRLESAAADPGVIQELESLVARAYAEIHSTRIRRPWRAAWEWLALGFPRTFRRQSKAFMAVLWITFAGMMVGAVAIATDRENRKIVFPAQFSHLYGSPSERVAQEEERSDNAVSGQEASFAASLMQNNIGVTIKALAFGITYGIGTALILFYNGVILGAVSFDYIADGQIVFLLAWLMPHGVTELPAIFIGGQAGFVLARALLGRGQRDGLRTRLRAVTPDLTSLILGAAALLVWAGMVEAFFSQHHEPAVPYAVKIAFGSVQLVALAAWLGWAGKPKRKEKP